MNYCNRCKSVVYGDDVFSGRSSIIEFVCGKCCKKEVEQK